MSVNDPGMAKNNPSNVMTIKINEATVAIVQSYLSYAAQVVGNAISKQGYGSTFKEIGDELIIQPKELIDLINDVQRALQSEKD